jgi:predicted DNA-binding ribbon-helix-helix protein
VAEPLDVLEKARRDVGLTVADLWYRYFTLGGMSTALEVEGVLYGALRATAHERDLLAVALNERFAELGGDHPVPYAGDEHDGDPS